MKNKIENNTSKVAKINKGSKLFALGAILLGTSAFAASSDESFTDLKETIIGWLTGSLGKLLALLGFAGTFIVYLMTHKGSVLFVGVIISLIAGGMVGIADKFFEAGYKSFGVSAVSGVN